MPGPRPSLAKLSGSPVASLRLEHSNADDEAERSCQRRTRSACNDASAGTSSDAGVFDAAGFITRHARAASSRWRETGNLRSWSAATSFLGVRAPVTSVRELGVLWPLRKRGTRP